MTAVARSHVVAAGIAVVEALKDQGIARWNYPLKYVHQRLKNNVRASIFQAATRSSSAASGSEAVKAMRMRKTEENMKKVMELNCFGPSTLRF